MKTKEKKTHYASETRINIDAVKDSFNLIREAPFVEKILDSMSNPVMVLNKYRQIVFFNKSFSDFLGINGKNLINGMRPGEAMDCIHSFRNPSGCGTTDFCKTCGAVNSILSAIDGIQETQECRITLQNGNALDLLVKSTPFQVEEENFILFAIQDISSEKRRRILERIFFHDIMNTVGCLYTSSKMLLNDRHSIPESRWETLFKIISESSELLVEEIEGQKALSDAENNEIKLLSANINSLDLLNKLISLIKLNKVCKGKNLRISPHSESVYFYTDPVLLKRVLLNMIKNAIEAIDKNELVTVGCRSEGNDVRFFVHNPGYIDRETQLQIFHRSFSTKGKGRGLGTYSMKLLSERYLQGRVEFVSFPESGTTFSAIYPVEKVISEK